ncbi:MAG: hypothetical protein KDK07_24020 [Bauldia sp.]|uniref:hypothetical protein n=1 Tax=Bauldia sp. TaxID=2575872 RepID=UPI001D237ABB|nr:hypothetical protein [Bauldia sp.]MCB1494508.1 hypothetical protein [Bauldia sp.]MCB1502806.1 hypothetical protein [Bauldia sp.]
MKILTSLAAGAVALACLTGAGYAQDAMQPTAQQAAELQTKVKVGTGIVALGRAEKNPMMMLVGAEILASLGAVSGPDNASKAYDVSTILGEAKALAGDDQYLLDKIAAVKTGGSMRSGERNCDWVQTCGYDISDPFACDWVLSCY